MIGKKGLVLKVTSSNLYTTTSLQKKKIPNTFDFFGDIVKMSRLDGESNADYKQRIMDFFANPGSSTYFGIINNITRDLGLSKLKPVVIDVARDESGNIIAENPAIEIKSNKVVLYKNWKLHGNSEVDKEIRFYNEDDAGYYLNDLVNEIDASSYFSADLDITISRRKTRSTNIVRGKSFVYIHKDLVPSANRFDLPVSPVIDDSMIFSEENVFQTEVPGTPSAVGEYNVDYENGVVYSFSKPSGEGTISYIASVFPFDIYVSEVELFTLQDDDFVDEIYHLEDGQRKLLKPEGAEIVHEIYKTEVFWGE